LHPLPQAQTLATEAGQGSATNPRGVGMNVNLAPVLDVYREAGDFDDQSAFPSRPAPSWRRVRPVQSMPG
jgi:beta-glucosidase-like glycosyl hydrolase